MHLLLLANRVPAVTAFPELLFCGTQDDEADERMCSRKGAASLTCCSHVQAQESGTRATGPGHNAQRWFANLVLAQPFSWCLASKCYCMPHCIRKFIQHPCAREQLRRCSSAVHMLHSRSYARVWTVGNMMAAPSQEIRTVAGRSGCWGVRCSLFL